MIAEMPTRKPKKKVYPRPADKADVFARLDVNVITEFDKLVEATEPPTTRSKYIAMLIRQHIEQRKREGR